MDLHPDLTELLTELAASGAEYLVVKPSRCPLGAMDLDVLIGTSDDNLERVVLAAKKRGWAGEGRGRLQTTRGSRALRMNEPDPTTRCEACHRRVLLLAIPASDGPPFRVCEQCHARLASSSLRPLEWFRLAAIHGPAEHWLHDDFYDDDGIAQAADGSMDGADALPYPAEPTWTESLDTALDVACTKRSLPESVKRAFAGDPSATLRLMRARAGERTTRDFVFTCLTICVEALGPAAETFVRAVWLRRDPYLLHDLSRASAACLPRDEALALVVLALRNMEPEQRCNHITALSWFVGADAIAAIEQLVAPPITESWGRAVAACEPSWPLLSAWLDRGRPMSLVALDALDALVRPDTPVLKKLGRTLLSPPDPATLRTVLASYADRDPVPRVRRAVARVCGEHQGER